MWALITATVGMILRSLQERAGILGRIVLGLVGIAWTVLTFFVVPVLLFEPVGVGDAIKRSGSIFRQRWGENFIGNGTIGLAIFFVSIPVLIVGGLITAAVPVLGIVLLVVAIGALMAVGSATTGVFNAALYRYATTGETSGAFTQEDMAASFRPKAEAAAASRRCLSESTPPAHSEAPGSSRPPSSPRAGLLGFRATVGPTRATRVLERVRTMGKDLYEIGELPPIGEVPAQMHAQLVRPDRYGEPESRDPGRGDRRPRARAARRARRWSWRPGVNFNNVWAARGIPVDVTKTQARWGEPTDFHIVGSDASGVVYAVGSEVTNVAVGDRVVVHAGQWDEDDPWVRAGKDPGLARELPGVGLRHLLGLVRPVLEGAGAPVPAQGRLTHVGGGRRADAHRLDRLPDALRLAAAHRGARRRRAGVGRVGRPRARSPSSSSRTPAAGRSPWWGPTRRASTPKQLGAVGYINRKAFDHWGVPPAWDSPEWKDWFGGAKAFGKAIWDVAGREGEPADRLRAPGPGHDPDLDLRGRPRRHGRDLRRHERLRHDGGRPLPLVHAEALPGLAPVQRRAGGGVQRARGRRQDPDDARARPTPTTRAGSVHQLMGDGELPEGNVSVLVNAPREGLTDLP